MTVGHRNLLAMVAACALLLTATATAQPQSGTIGGVTGGDAVAIGVAIAVIGAGIGFGVFYAVHHAVHHGHSLDGCAVSGANGLELQNRGDQQTYALVGDTAGIKPGERVRISGKKEKKNGGAHPQFLVEKLNKDFGACNAEPSIR